MAKVEGPLLSLGAGGALGESIVFSSWKGINYVKKYVVPANPNSTDQQTQRAYFGNAVDAFHGAEYILSDRLSLNRAATFSGKAQSGFNLMVGKYIDMQIAGDTMYQLRDLEVISEAAGQLEIGVSEHGDTSDLTVKLLFGTNPNFLVDQGAMAWDAGDTRYEKTVTGLVAGVVYYWAAKVTSAGDGGYLGIYRHKKS